jgi:hypothetical protein
MAALSDPWPEPSDLITRSESGAPTVAQIEPGNTTTIPQKNRSRKVRIGSKSEVTARYHEVRFASEAGHRLTNL